MYIQGERYKFTMWKVLDKTALTPPMKKGKYYIQHFVMQYLLPTRIRKSHDELHLS